MLNRAVEQVKNNVVTCSGRTATCWRTGDERPVFGENPTSAPGAEQTTVRFQSDVPSPPFADIREARFRSCWSWIVGALLGQEDHTKRGGDRSPPLPF